MSVATVIGRFTSGTYTVTRTAAGAYTGGIYAAGAASTFNIDADVFPVTGRELQALAEGQHGAELRQIFTLTELKTRSPTTEPDTVSIGGETWEVFRVDAYPSFYRAVVARKAIP